MPTPLAQLRHMRARRRALNRAFSVASEFAALEESCIPSYLHRNPVLAYGAWWRLFAAVRLGLSASTPGPVLDFGASAGELYHLLPADTEYCFVEHDERLAQALDEAVPAARRLGLETLPEARFATVFALDSLEHNPYRVEILRRLRETLDPQGVLVVSGPTETVLYRLGRRAAGFRGHGHEADIYAIEDEISHLFQRRKLISGPFGLPLFRISVWGKI
jgi:FAD/FMN-containing dehydrogenase